MNIGANIKKNVNSKERKKQMKTTRCITCGKEFSISVEEDNIEYCSLDCIIKEVEEANLQYQMEHEEETFYCGCTEESEEEFDQFMQEAIKKGEVCGVCYCDIDYCICNWNKEKHEC